MSATERAWLQIHFCVVLWGFTAILGKLISLPALPLVWWRMLIVAAVLALVPRVHRSLQAMPARLMARVAGVGVLVAAHWVTFYAAIKLSNASVAATCIALAPVFLSIVEPWIAKRPFDARELGLGLAVVPGVALVVGGIPDSMRLGLAVGVLSAVLVAFFASFNKRLVTKTDALSVTALEMGAGALAITALAPFLPATSPLFVVPTLRDAALLGLLASVCTLLPFVLALVALRHLSAFGSTLAVNLEPVYAIFLAMIFFGEQRDVTLRFYVGVGIILAAVFTYPLIHRDPQGSDVGLTPI